MAVAAGQPPAGRRGLSRHRRLLQRRQGRRERGEVLHQAVDVRLVVLDRDQPLLALPPRRQEHPAVVLVQPVRVAVRVVDAEEVAEVPDRVGREHHAALGADGDHVRGQAVADDLSLEPGHGLLPERLDPLVRGGRDDLAEHGPGGGHGQRVAVEGPDHVVVPGGHVPHDLLGAADGRHGHAAADGLGQADDVRGDPGHRGHAARPGGEPGLHLVERQQRAAGVQQVLQAGQVAGLGQDDPRVHHDRLEDHPGDLARVLVQQPGDAVEVVEADDQGEIGDRPRDPGAGRDLVRPARGADLVDLGVDRDLDRVVMAVVAALDLDDQVAAGDRAHQVHGVHRGLGAGVGEPPQRQPEPAGQLLGDHDRGARGLGEVGAERGLGANRLHDRGVAVPGQRHAVPAVQVDVLVAVDVVDLGALAVAEPDRLRPGDLPAGGDPAGERRPARSAMRRDSGCRAAKISSCSAMISSRLAGAAGLGWAGEPAPGPAGDRAPEPAVVPFSGRSVTSGGESSVGTAWSAITCSLCT